MDGQVDVYGSQSANGATEVRIFPNVAENLVGILEVVEKPGVSPGEDEKEQADFQREEGEHIPKDAIPAGRRIGWRNRMNGE